MKNNCFTLRFLRTAALGVVTICALTAGAFAVDTGVITGDVVNARSGPGTGYSRVELLAKGKQVTILAEDGNWFKIAWNNSTGYVYKSYVSASNSGSTAAASSATPNATITGGNINVRTGPGTGYSRITVVGTGKRVAVLETSGNWYKIGFDGKTGYIISSYVIRDDAAATQSAAATAAPAPAATTPTATTAAPAAAVEGNATVKGGNINVRSGPGTGYSRVAIVGTGKRVTLLSEAGGWCQIGFDGKTGYILGSYLTPDAGALEALTAAEAAGTDIPAATVESSVISGNDADGSSGGSRPGIITGGTINVRTGAGTEYERLTQVSTGKKVTILAEENGWFQISFDGKTGYVLDDYVFEGDSLPASSVGAQIAAMAAQYVGTRYVYGGASPSGFDCSGFTLYLYKQFGYSLPHTASGQYANCGVKVSRSDLQPGDLVFFTSSGSGGRITHVGVYTGNDQIIHARYSVGAVHVNYLSESYYNRNYVGAIRIA
ncbi:MAG: SH3 domain-containing protein [Oscillospiraceae bacterium]|nr:SH3 domain-containing protein [Oscillospiraceae bacterium]